MFNKIFLALLVSSFALNTLAQTIINQPNFGRKSHATLTVERIVAQKNRTVLILSIENQRTDGAFCLDKNIYVQSSMGGPKLPVIETKGLPTCPENHYFSAIGERVEFSLIFDELPADVKYLNLVEDCAHACFFIEGILLDEQTNVQINKSYAAYMQKNYYEAAGILENFLSQNPNYPYGVYQYNLAKIYSEMGENQLFKERYKAIKNASLKDKQAIIEQIKSPEFFR